MQTSVTLTQVPYTGFDYGNMYNSLYWVGILVWSLIIALIIIKNKQRVAHLFAGLAKVFIVEKRQRASVQISEPQILEERVVIFDPLVDPIAARKMRDNTTIQQEMHTVVEHTPSIIEGNKYMQEGGGSTERVKKLVQKELAVSRIGQQPDEFSNDDFDTVDFDGVNPDDSWVEKSREVPIPTIKPVQIQEFKQEGSTKVESSKKYDLSAHAAKLAQELVPKAKPTSETSRIIPEPKNDKVFTDSIALDTESEYPKIVLTREEVIA